MTIIEDLKATLEKLNTSFEEWIIIVNKLNTIENTLLDYTNLKREHEFLREHYNELLKDYLELKGQK